MIAYLDASALVKRYITESGSAQTIELVKSADLIATCIISRAEVSAALSKAVRVGALDRERAEVDLYAFRNDWQGLIRVDITEATAARADALAWEHNLRGYDAVHLASALFWQESMDERITLVTFDKQLWSATKETGLLVFPEDL